MIEKKFPTIIKDIEPSDLQEVKKILSDKFEEACGKYTFDPRETPNDIWEKGMRYLGTKRTEQEEFTIRYMLYDSVGEEAGDRVADAMKLANTEPSLQSITYAMGHYFTIHLKNNPQACRYFAMQATKQIAEFLEIPKNG